MNTTITCPCPPRADGTARHPNGDTIRFLDRLPFRSIETIHHALSLVAIDDDRPDAATNLAVLTEYYVLLGIESWSLVDEKGKPMPVTRAMIRSRLLENPEAEEQALAIADFADGIYSVQVLRPLMQRASRSSKPTPTESSTSPSTGSVERRPKPSKRSSTSTSRTDATEATSTSLDGVSGSSQSLGSAA
jgi:hypothetical protein